MTRVIERDRALRRVAERIAPFSRTLLGISATGGALMFVAYICFEANLLPRTRFITRAVWIIAFLTVETCVLYSFGWLFGPRYEQEIVNDENLVRTTYPLALFNLGLLALLGAGMLWLAW